MTVAVANTKFTDLERAILRPRVVYALADWAERFRFVTAGPLIPPSGAAVRWSNQTFPLQLAIMEALEDPTWSHVVVMAPPQAGGKTDTVGVNLILKAIHHDHRDCAYVGATDTKANDFWNKKIGPAMSTPSADASLRALIPGDRDSIGNRDRRDFTNGTSLFLVGSNSSADLSSFTAPVIVCDDVQAMPKSLQSFGHPMDLAFARTGSYAEEDTIKVALGTAGIEGDRLDAELKASTGFQPYVPCLKCGTYQLITWDRMEFDKTDPVAAFGDCWMRCDNDACGHKMRDEELPAMLRAFRWAARGQTVEKAERRKPKTKRQGGFIPSVSESVPHPRGPESPQGDGAPAHKGAGHPPAEGIGGNFGRVRGALPKTRIAGFWWNALYWPFAGWGKFAAEWVSAQGNPEKLKDFQQRVLAIPYKEPEIDEERLTVAELEKHVPTEGYPAGAVPDWADVVTTAVDVQSGYVFFVVRAWRIEDGTSALITLGTRGKGLRGRRFDSREDREAARMTGITQGLTEVDDLIAEGFPRVNDKGEVVGKIHVARGVIDRGAWPTTIAAWWARYHRGVWYMIKGQRAGVAGVLWPTTKRSGLKFDGRNRPWRLIAVNESKSLARRLMRIGPNEPGYWHMPSTGIHPKTLRTYFSHLAAERYRADMSPPRWQPDPKDARHDYWDCETYIVAVALGLGVRLPFITTQSRGKAKSATRRPRQRGFLTPDGRPFLATER